MAIKDAIVLAETFAQSTADQDSADVLKQYESEMCGRAGKSVIRSRETTFMHQGIFDK